MGTAPWLTCIGRAKKGKKLEVCETGYMGEGQKTELYSSPPTASLVQRQKCVHRAKEETEGVQKGGEKSEKSKNEKDRRRKDALSSARMGEKDMGEMIGGSHL